MLISDITSASEANKDIWEDKKEKYFKTQAHNNVIFEFVCLDFFFLLIG